MFTFLFLLHILGYAEVVESGQNVPENSDKIGSEFRRPYQWTENGVVKNATGRSLLNPLVMKMMNNPKNVESNVEFPPLGAIKDLQCFAEAHKNSYFESPVAKTKDFKRRCNQFKVGPDDIPVAGKKTTPYFKIRRPCNAMVVDYTSKPTKPRGWLIDICTGEIKGQPFAVAHGKFGASNQNNTTPGPQQGTITQPLEMDDYSNTPDTNASAHGFFVAGHNYNSQRVGPAMVYHGVEGGVNENACKRATVVHAKEGVTCDSANKMTNGCLGVCQERLGEITNFLSGSGTDASGDHSTGGLIYIVSPEEKRTLGYNCGRAVNTAPNPNSFHTRPD